MPQRCTTSFRIAKPPAVSRSLLIDAGGSHHGYASDITRTYANSAPEHRKFADLIDAMDDHQQQLVAAVRPGVAFADLHERMHIGLCGVLADAGIVTCSAADAFEARVSEAFCPHGLGHLLGLQVHDVGGHLADAEGTPAPPADNYPALRFTRQVEEDYVFTIEPGLYFIDSLLQELADRGAPVDWQVVDALRPYGGIRIEDNVVVTATGADNLTRDAMAAL